MCEALHTNLELDIDEAYHICTRDPSSLEIPCAVGGGGLLLCGPQSRTKLYGKIYKIFKLKN